MLTRKSRRKERPRLVTPLDATLPPRPLFESVEAFLARGGTIERLDHGARGQSSTRPFRQMVLGTTTARAERIAQGKK